jgi:hypothetical protein
VAKSLTVEELAGDLQRALGDRLVALLLYGSAARGEDAAVGSDMNTLLICDRVDAALFDALEPVVSRWTRQGQPGPLIFTRAEWRESADAFPIEYDDIRHAHRLLGGQDPWEGIVVRREDLRRQLEHELRGKVVRLRQVYAAFRGDGTRLAEAIAASLAGFLTMLRTALRLTGHPVPAAGGDVVRAAGADAGFDPEPVVELLQRLRGPQAGRLAPRDPRAAAYLEAVTRTAEFVNALSGK